MLTTVVGIIGVVIAVLMVMMIVGGRRVIVRHGIQF